MVLWQFWHDESGMVNPSSYVLMVTLLGIGMIAGLSSLRDGIVQEFGDAAQSLRNLDQTFTFNVTLANGSVLQGGFDDNEVAGNDVFGQAPFGILICENATPE